MTRDFLQWIELRKQQIVGWFQFRNRKIIKEKLFSLVRNHKLKVAVIVLLCINYFFPVVELHLNRNINLPYGLAHVTIPFVKNDEDLPQLVIELGFGYLDKNGVSLGKIGAKIEKLGSIDPTLTIKNTMGAETTVKLLWLKFIDLANHEIPYEDGSSRTIISPGQEATIGFPKPIEAKYFVPLVTEGIVRFQFLVDINSARKMIEFHCFNNTQLIRNADPTVSSFPTETLVLSCARDK